MRGPDVGSEFTVRPVGSRGEEEYVAHELADTEVVAQVGDIHEDLDQRRERIRAEPGERTLGRCRVVSDGLGDGARYLRAVVRQPPALPAVSGQVAVHHGEQRDFLALLLQADGDGVRHDAAEGPAQEGVRAGGLNCSDLVQVVLDHLLQPRGRRVRLAEPTGLQPVERLLTVQMPQEAGVRPTQPDRRMDTEQRVEIAFGAQREQDPQRVPGGTPGRAVQPSDKGGDGGGFEEGAYWEFGVQGGADAADEAGGEEGVAAEFEEVVVDADGGYGEDFGEQSAEGFLLGGSWGASGAGGGLVGGGQGLVVDLAVGGQREPVQDQERGGDHVLGQQAGGVRAQRFDVHGVRGVVAGLGDEVGDEAFVAGVVLAGGDRDLGQAGVAAQYGLDLAEFDAEPADLDLVVGAAHELQQSCVGPAGQVAGAVHPAPGRAEGIGHEALRRQVRAPVVAAGQSRAGQVQLSGDAGGQQ